MGLDPLMPMSEELPENGKVKKLVGKVKEKKTIMGMLSKEKPTAKPD